MKYKQRKEIELQKQCVLMALPSFINQLLLLLGSGMVLHEAMTTIAVNYQSIFEELKEPKDEFKRVYIDLYMESQKTGKSFIHIFNKYCEASQIKELNRIARILVDADNRGTNLCQKLSEESEKLWEQRKRIVLERIRLSESKMSFPLGLLLIALIIIAAAPAMMQMYI